MKKLLENSQKLTNKLKKYAPIFQFETHFQALQNTVASISEVNISK